MFDDFFIRALIAGIGIAIVTGPLGCLVIWRRLSYFGDTLSHSALLGVTLAYTFDINISLSVFIISGMIAIVLLDLQKRTKLPGDALLGILSHSTLAVGLVVIGFLSFIRFDLMGLLFGDILAVTIEDIFIIWIGGFIILGVLYFIWKSLFAATVSYDLAAAEGMKPDQSNFIFTLLLAGVIAISIKMIGVLLITGLLLIPSAMSRNLSNNPQQMILFSILGGTLSVIIGLFSSLEFNTASGPSIIVVALIFFILSLLPFKRKTALQK
jgi:zinc transport system permease protein